MRFKRVLTGLLAVLLIILQAGMPVLAEEGEEKTPEQIQAEEEAKKQERYNAVPESNTWTNWPAGPNVYADSAIVMDMNSKAVLYSKQSQEQLFPASITKFLTVLVALENAELTDRVTFSEESIAILNYDDAQIGMKPGEELSLEDALYAVLLASANEVSYAVAESIGRKMGGGYDTFIQAMNDRAAELGCTNSHWVNPNGLHDDNHYTTVRDMALITAALYQRPEFFKFMQTLEYRIGPTNLTAEERIFQQNHRMMWPENFYFYEYCTGGKTGFTDQAQTTLITTADNGTLQLVAVTMHDFGTDVYVDTRAMLDYGFQNFSKALLKDNDHSEDIKSFIDPQAYVLLPAGADFSQLMREIVITGGDRAEATYTLNGQVVGIAGIIVSDAYLEKIRPAHEDVANTADPGALETAAASDQDTLTTAVSIGKTIMVVIIILVLAIIALILLIQRRRMNARQERGRRRRNRNRNRN